MKKRLNRKQKDGLLVMLNWIEFTDDEDMLSMTGLTPDEAEEALVILKSNLSTPPKHNVKKIIIHGKQKRTTKNYWK